MSDRLHITEVGRVAVVTADQDKALEFYVGTLGLELRADLKFGDGKMRWIEVAPAGAATSIALTPPMEGTTPSRRRPGSCSPPATSRPITPRSSRPVRMSIRRSPVGATPSRRCSGCGIRRATR